MQDTERNKVIAKDYEVLIKRTQFSAEGIGVSERGEHRVLGAFPGERVMARGARKKHGYPTGHLLSVLETPYQGEKLCKDFRLCGGCVSQHLPLDEQRSLKEQEVLELFREKGISLVHHEGLFGADRKYGYRNKVDFTFGNQYKGGPLHLGFHQKAMRRNVLDTSECLLIHEDLRKIRDMFAAYFTEKQLPFYDIYSHEGLLRFLLLRRAEFTGQILIVLIVSSQGEVNGEELDHRLRALELEGRIRGFLIGRNDRHGNFVHYDSLSYFSGEDFIEEELCDLSFRIYPASFFQTNSAGAQILFQKTLELMEGGEVLWDLYCGAGTIGQIASKKYKKIIGIELSEEAVEAAKQSALRNDLHNCEYYIGDVKEAIEAELDSPDLVVVDPPRAGLHPRVVQSLLKVRPPAILYVSCNPVTQVRDVEVLREAYEIDKSFFVDLYPNTGHVETVVLMSRVDK